jgi:hypothetical protein
MRFSSMASSCTQRRPVVGKLRGSNARVDLTSLIVFNFRLGEAAETPESTTPNIHLNFATQLRPKRFLSYPGFPIPLVCPYIGAHL